MSAAWSIATSSPPTSSWTTTATLLSSISARPRTKGPELETTEKQQDEGSSARPTFSASGHAVIPRGLRAFTEQDAGFFLDLLPGPRNRDGLPDSVLFWKTRLETRRAEDAF